MSTVSPLPDDGFWTRRLCRSAWTSAHPMAKKLKAQGREDGRPVLERPWAVAGAVQYTQIGVLSTCQSRVEYHSKVPSYLRLELKVPWSKVDP